MRTRRKTKPGEPLAFLNDVVLPYASNECLFWPYAISSNGYGNVTYQGVKHSTSRLVCELVNGPAPTPLHQAAHSCGKGHLGCVNPKHLRWATSKENINDRRVHGTAPVGDRNGASKLTNSQARYALAMRGKVPGVKLAKAFGVSPAAIYLLHSGKNWSFLQEERS